MLTCLKQYRQRYHIVEEVMLTCLKQYRQRHACRAHKRKVVEPLYVIPYRFSSFLDCREEFVHGHRGIIFVKSGEELGFRSSHFLMEFTGRLLNQSKDTPLRVLMNSLAMIASLLPHYRFAIGSSKCADLVSSCHHMSKRWWFEL